MKNYKRILNPLIMASLTLSIFSGFASAQNATGAFAQPPTNQPVQTIGTQNVAKVPLVKIQPPSAQAPTFPQTIPVNGAQQKQKVNDDLQGPFYLVDESPIQVIKILESLSGQIALQSPQLPDVKINFATSGKLPRSEAILAFKSLLAINGIAITPMGEKFFKAAPASGVTSQAPTFLFGKPSEMPPSQFFYSKLYELKYIDIESFKDNLTPFLSPNNISNLSIFPRSNAFMLTDTLVNHQRIEMLLEKLDVAPDVSEEVKFFTLKNMSAEDLKRRLTGLQGDILKKYLDKTTIESDERTNQVIVITRRGNMKFLSEIIDKLDVDSEPLTKSEVFYVRHGEAKDVANVLNQIVKGQQSAVKSAQATKTNAAAQANRTNRIINAQNAARGSTSNLPTNTTADQTGASLQFSEYITIVPDERSNAIVCYGTPTDLKQISNIIAKVDVILAQVKIDVIIVEVTLTDKQVSGLSSFGLDYTTIKTDGKKGWSGTTSMYGLNDGGQSPFEFTLSEYGFSSVFRVAQENNMVKILSSPSVVTTHNKKASIIVSQKHPLITGTTTYAAVSTPSTTSTIDWKDIGIELEVTPRIGENGVIQMEISQKVSTVVSSTTINDNTQPIIGNREAESYVSATSGETIVLAGLQQSNVTDTNGAVWLLSDIPLIGDLFAPERQVIDRTELIFFIRPTVIKSESFAKALLNSPMKDSIARGDIEKFIADGRFSDGYPGKFPQTSFERTIAPDKDAKGIIDTKKQQELEAQKKADAEKKKNEKEAAKTTDKSADKRNASSVMHK